MDKEKFVLTSIVSAVGGTLIGLLFAPDKGSNTRKKLSERSDEILQEISNDFDSIRDGVNKKTASARKEIDDLGKNVKDRGDDVLEKTQKMASYEEWTKDELYERAKRLEIENYSTMNKSELIEALRKR